MTSIRKAVALSFAERYASLVIQFFSTVIIARLLSPQEIGIYSVGAGVIAIAHTLRDFGVTAYLIQEAELTLQRQRAAFTVMLMVTWSISFILLVGAGSISEWYQDGRLHEVLIVLSVNFLAIPFGAVTLALLKRELAFGTILRITVFSTAVHSTTAVVLAMNGFGFMSLAWASFAGTLATVLGALAAKPATVVLIPTTKEIRRVLGFGGKMSLSSMASEAGNSAPDIVIGRTHGFEAVGYFSRATGFTLLFERVVLDGLRGVMLPYFSREKRIGSDVADKLDRAAMNLLGIAWPMLGLMGIMAGPFIEILYGDQWQESVPLAKILVLAIAVRCLNPAFAAVLLSVGEVNRVTVVQLTYQCTKIAVVVIASLQSLTAVCWGLVASDIIGTVAFMTLLRRIDAFGYRAYMRSAMFACVLTIAACGPVVLLFGLSGIMEGVSLFVEVAVACALWLAGFAAGLCALGHPLKNEVETLYLKVTGRL